MDWSHLSNWGRGSPQNHRFMRSLCDDHISSRRPSERYRNFANSGSTKSGQCGSICFSSKNRSYSRRGSSAT